MPVGIMIEGQEGLTSLAVLASGIRRIRLGAWRP
jgi:hypothetical protein